MCCFPAEEEMKEIFNNYLTTIQYNKICKYWKVFEKISYKLENFNYSNYRYYEEFSDDEETILECIEHNGRLDIYIQKLRGKLIHYQQEYEKYINSIGFELNDRTYDETLFNLLNNGIVLD